MGMPVDSVPRWYVIHTYSGYENKVAGNIEKIVENRGLSDMIFDVKVPTEKVIEISGHEKKKSNVKYFPATCWSK